MAHSQVAVTFRRPWKAAARTYSEPWKKTSAAANCHACLLADMGTAGIWSPRLALGLWGALALGGDASLRDVARR